MHAFRYSDDSMIVSILTRSRGAVPFLFKVPKGRHSSLKAQLLRPLTMLEIEMDFRERMQMQRIKDMHVDVNYASLPYEPAKEALAMFLGEALYHALKHEERNDELFDFLSAALQWLDLADSAFANFHLCLLIQLTRHLGFFPNTDEAGPGTVFDLMEGCFVHAIPCHGQYLPYAETQMFPHLLKMNFATMHRVHLNRQQRGRILKVLNLYYRLHLPDYPELKSLDVLTELFD